VKQRSWQEKQNRSKQESARIRREATQIAERLRALCDSVRVDAKGAEFFQVHTKHRSALESAHYSLRKVAGGTLSR
jgi:hypothetical protein